MKKKIFKSLFSVLICLCFGMSGCNFTGDNSSLYTEQTAWVFQYNDDDGTHQIEVEYGMPYSIEHIPQREGYDFLGLFDAEVGGTKYVASNGSSVSVWSEKRNMVLFPHWQAKKYTLQLNYGDAPDAGIDCVEVPYDSEILGLPEDFYVEGSEFIGWYNTQDASGSKFVNGAVMNKQLAALADENNRISLYAIFETAKYAVRFYSFDGNTLLAEKQVAHGTEISKVAPKTLSDGSEILGWSTSKNGYGYEYRGEITTEMDLYVRDFRYVLTLDYGYGNQKDVIRVNRGGSCTLPDISRERYIFNGWYENGTKVNKQYTPERSATLTARWTANFYTVSFNANGGSSVSTREVVRGGTIDLPSVSRVGYSFNYWKTLSGARVTSPYKPTGDITLYADWTANTYTITFNLNGGSMSEGTKRVTYDSSYSLPVPSRSGFTFLGWYTGTGRAGKRQTNAQGASLSVWKHATDMTLIAIWTKNYELNLSRSSCKDKNGYNPNSGGTDVDLLAHHDWDILNLIIGGCAQDANGDYFVPEGSTLSLSFKVLQDIGALPTWGMDGESINWTKHWMNSDTYSGNVYGTNISNKTIGKGAYYVKITYTDDSILETNQVNFLNDAKKDDVIQVPLNIIANKQIKSLEVVAVYELYYDYMTDAWNWGGTKCYANWRCTKSIEFC